MANWKKESFEEVVSDEGHIVSMRGTDRETQPVPLLILYKEPSGKKIMFRVPPRFKDGLKHYYPRDDLDWSLITHWDEPFDSEALSPEELKDIKKHVLEGFELLFDFD